MARAILELIGDPSSAVRALKQTSEATKQLGVTAEQSARAQVAAATKRDARLREQIAVYRQIARAAEQGSREQIAAANLATRAEERLGRSLAVTSSEAKQHARAVAGAEREIGKFSRGALAGSGIARSLGRSLAFASGGFLATASITGLFRSVIGAGTEAAATQKQLAAQFRASGQDLNQYRARIDEATQSVSRLAGIEDDELLRAFTTAFRGTKEVTSALRIQAVAADVARGRHIGLAQAAIALTKAYGGQTTALRRLGIQVPTNLTGLQALEFVARRFAGQAAAGATAQDKFRAALHNTAQAVGIELLPQFTAMLNKATAWLNVSQNQTKVQHAAKTSAQVLAQAMGTLADAYTVAAFAAQKYSKFATEAGKSPGPLGIAFKVLFQPGFGLGALAKLLSGGGGGSAGAASPTGLSGPVGSATSGLTGPVGKASGPLGFKARFANLEIALARAELTQQQADDERVLAAEAALVRERIKTLGTSRKTLAERTTLTQQLVGIDGQIATIEQTAAQNRKTAQDKILAAQAKRLADEKTAADKELSTLKQREANLKQKIKAITDSFKSAVDTARSSIGGLFGGPVLNFSDEQRRAALGIPNTAADPRALVRDLNAQVRQASAFQRNLARLGRRGAPTELIKELQAGGLANATQVQALAGASRGTLQQFFKAFGAREKLAQNIARADMKAQLVTLHADRLRLATVRGNELKIEVEIKGIEKSQAKVKVKQSAAQRRGNTPGRA